MESLTDTDSVKGLGETTDFFNMVRDSWTTAPPGDAARYLTSDLHVDASMRVLPCVSVNIKWISVRNFCSFLFFHPIDTCDEDGHQ